MRVDKVKGRPPDFQSVERGVRLSLSAIEYMSFINSSKGVKLHMELMYYTIYKTTHISSGKYYIGMHQTKDLEDGYLGSGKYFLNALRKYGKDSFTKEILYVFDNHEDMVSKEKELVNEAVCSDKSSYNIKKGGKGGFTKENSAKGRTAADIVIKEKYGVDNPSQLPQNRKRLSKQTTERNLSGLSKFDNFKGKKHTEETKRRIGTANSINSSGNKNSQFGTMWITNGIENKKIKKNSILPEGWQKGRKIKS